MKKILLISNHVFHYRQKVYNAFVERFNNDGYEFHVASNSFQNAGYDFKFKEHIVEMSIHKYFNLINDLKPECVILFLHLKDYIQIPIILYCRLNKIPVIFWNKGISVTDGKNPFKNFVYHRIHDSCDALITYTPDMKVNFQRKNYNKLFIAYNSLDFSDIDKSKYSNIPSIKKKYGIKEKYVILYVSRMQPYKRPDLLADLFAYQRDVAVVFMGSGMTAELKEKIDAADNLYYLGQKYGDEGNEVFAMGDVFSTPGNIGLSICDALFWNLPICILKGNHAPEIYYMKDGKTGFFAKDEASFKERVLDLLDDQEELARMRRECQMEYEAEVSIDRMYQGFIDAIRFCS